MRPELKHKTLKRDTNFKMPWGERTPLHSKEGDILMGIEKKWGLVFQGGKKLEYKHTRNIKQNNKTKIDAK